MRTVTHREMRNQSAEVLRRVEAGESVIVTNHGRAAAVISPIGRPVFEELVERGQVRVASKGVESLRDVFRRRSNLTSAQLLADTRGPW
jgi:prevent-host-death family protein